MNFLILTITLFIFACIPLEDTDSLYVDYVIDGDTFVIEDGRIIRVWGIDAPEKDQPYYQTATLTLESFIEDELLECIFIAKGKYRRDLMRCYVGDNDIGALMVEKGMAKNYGEFPNDYYLSEEITAQQKKRGIWSEK